ncbi:chemotaxis protein CheB [Sporomusa termitida]|uniref:protein-glutamate methylesterase n=1 Tax=Sporomusa termitida TaxID=2377 RepID=A0A517DQJ5_9FIRM|nr:chemotaxis protein CheB [Sporomusa termitida]QDR79632.1 Chemotaxis response regulator protein-glutamate methyleSPTERase [Sporomusa termitida]
MNYGIVVAGASLGGLHALRTLLQGLPKDFPLPVAIVQHRGKDSGEPLSTYLQSCSALEIVEAEDKDKIVSGRVYVAPADYHLLIEDGWFSLSTEPQVRYSRPSIDILFESAAYAYGKKAIGVLLTGANQDGAAGLKKIKERGGLTIAQDPVTAECGVMPGSAIAARAVDRVLPLERISGFLREKATRAIPQGEKI